VDIFDLIKQGKIKRYFRSRKKISYPGAINHITQRAPGKEMLFIEEGDYLHMLHLIKSVVKMYKLRFFSFVLMPNHVHLLFQLNKDNLSVSLKHLFNRYALYFNKKYERKGHVFCGRFRQALCFDESYLLASSVYIHINPLVAGIVNNITQYRWSSVIPFIQKFKKKTFIDYQFILHLLDRDIRAARQLYKKLIQNAIQIKIKHFWDNPKALDSFKDELIASLEKMNAQFYSVLSVDSEIKELRGKKYGHSPETKAAMMYMVEQLRAKGYSVSEIAQKLSMSRQSIYNIMKSA
jgi:putative transposase